MSSHSLNKRLTKVVFTRMQAYLVLFLILISKQINKNKCVF